MKREIKERKVDECFECVEIWDASHSKSKQMDKRIAEMLIVDDLLFSHVEDIGFMRLMTKCSPQYKVKQRKFYSSIICNEIYDSVSTKTKAFLKNQKINNNKIYFTTDAWTDAQAGVSFFTEFN